MARRLQSSEALGHQEVVQSQLHAEHLGVDLHCLLDPAGIRNHSDGEVGLAGLGWVSFGIACLLLVPGKYVVAKVRRVNGDSRSTGGC